MTTSRRRTPLPPNWPAIRTYVLARDGHRCTWTDNDQRCPTTTRLEVDHLGPPDNHDPRYLRTLCYPHHLKRTSAQANAAKTPRQRPTEPHPGATP